MIDRVSQSGMQVDTNNGSETRRVLRMVKNERMGGFVPSWENVTTPRSAIENNLSLAQNGQSADPGSAMAYQPAQTAQGAPEEFGFADLLDMVNPLQHIPVVGHFYRRLTGDEIKPIGQIIGGAIFGGPLGAASGLVNAVVINETGKDIADNAFSFALNGEVPHMRTPAQPDKPELRLNAAVKTASTSDLPGELLAFTDLGHGVSQDREAVIQNAYAHINNPSPREPITQLELNTMVYEIY